MCYVLVIWYLALCLTCALIKIEQFYQSKLFGKVWRWIRVVIKMSTLPGSFTEGMNLEYWY